MSLRLSYFPECDLSQDSCKKLPYLAEEVVEDHCDGVKGNEDMGFEEEDEGDDDKTTTLLTNEELNERVEAFISRFRQEYLVSDVKIISRSSSRAVVVEHSSGFGEIVATDGDGEERERNEKEGIFV
ncbi:hypothetical protein Tco_1372083 [Tanacetum coccineum]